MGAVDSFRLGFHPIGHESLRLRGYPVVLFRNEIPRGNCLPAGGRGLFLKRGTTHWALGDSHHICHVSWCVRAERLVKVVALDVQLRPAGGPRRGLTRKTRRADRLRRRALTTWGGGSASRTPETLAPPTKPMAARKTRALTLLSPAAA